MNNDPDKFPGYPKISDIYNISRNLRDNSNQNNFNENSIMNNISNNINQSNNINLLDNNNIYNNNNQNNFNENSIVNNTSNNINLLDNNNIYNNNQNNLYEDNINLLKKKSMSSLGVIVDTIKTVVTKKNSIDVDLLINNKVDLKHVYKYGIFSWQQLIECGLNKNHLTRDKWLDFDMLGNTLKITLKIMFDELKFDINDVYKNNITIDELKMIKGNNINLLIEMGLNKLLFLSLPYTLNEWYNILGLNLNHLKSMNLTVDDYYYLIGNKNWNVLIMEDLLGFDSNILIIRQNRSNNRSNNFNPKEPLTLF
jgi:hypothetical protein